MIVKDQYFELLRNNFPAFVHRVFQELHPSTTFKSNWHIDLICEKLEDCRSGKIKRLIINIPPRNLKSIICSVALPAWILGHNPSAKIICVSFGQDLAEKLSSDCRKVMEADWYQQLFPNTRLVRKTCDELVTSAHGMRLARSVGGSITGRGGDYIIFDDPLKPEEAMSEAIRNSCNNWYDQTLLTRLDDKVNGCMIIIMQRLHENDLVGHVLEKEPWEKVVLPAIAESDEYYVIKTPYGERLHFRKTGDVLHPEREPLEILMQLKARQGEYIFSGQYQQSPSPLDGGYIKRKWFKEYCSLPPRFDFKIQSWDTASKATEFSDYCVCTTWGKSGHNYYLIDVYREKLEFPELKRAVMAQIQKHNPEKVLVEDQASGIQLIQQLRSEGIYIIRAVRPDTDKVSRMITRTTVIESGFVFLPEKAPWKEAYLHELLVFPNGKHDDQVDSTSQALEELMNIPMYRIRCL